MALSLAMPLFGLDPAHFSALNMRLLNIDNEQNLRNFPGSGRASPSAGSESSGISSLATSSESTLAELTPVPSRPETPIRVSCKNQEKVSEIRTVYRERNLLNLHANIRSPTSWQITVNQPGPYQPQTHRPYLMTECKADGCGFKEPR